MYNNNGDSEQYIAVLPFCLSLKPNPLQEVGSKSKSVDLLIFTRSVRILAQIWLISWLVDVCVTHLKLKPRWLSLEYHPPNWKISLTCSVTQSILSQCR